MGGSLSRRAFIGSSVAAAGALAAPRIHLTSNKSGREPIIVGEGEHRFEVLHDWAKCPSDIAFGNTHGVCEDSQGRIYIKHTIHASSARKECRVVFDPTGKFVGAWGSELGIADGAHGLHLSKEKGAEFLYLCDQARGLVFKTDLDGRLVWKLGVPEESGVYGSASEYRPTNIAIAPSGDFYVGDGYGKSWIHQYTPDARYVRSFGGPGSERGQLACPHGLMVDTRGPEPVLLVADRANHRIQTFTLDGRPRLIITDAMKLPCHFHEKGGVLLVPDLDSRVTLLDRDNRLIAHLCDGGSQALRAAPRDQFIPGKFITPHGAIFDHAGDIYVVEWVEVGRVTKLRRVS